MSANPNQDSDELESLFDSIVAANTAESGPEAERSAVHGQGEDKVLNQIGHMTRTLHNTLRELGLNKEIEKAASTIPDARDRLNYVATLTEKAAERVLNATDAAQPIVDKMGGESARLAGQWQMLFDKKLDVEQFRNLVMQTQSFLNDVPNQTKATNAHLMEIMMAQDFQDLTGQVIKKVVDLAQTLETQLLQVLIEVTPPDRRGDKHEGLMNGPVVSAQGRDDVVTTQEQVDDLLGSLGF
jgi:chemotaxis protein CheZ